MTKSTEIGGRAIMAKAAKAMWNHGPYALPTSALVTARESYDRQPMISWPLQLFRRTEILLARCGSTTVQTHIIGVSHEILIIVFVCAYVVEIDKETKMLLMVWVRHLDFSHSRSPPCFEAQCCLRLPIGYHYVREGF